jgi:hypothetical protein
VPIPRSFRPRGESSTLRGRTSASTSPVAVRSRRRQRGGIKLVERARPAIPCESRAGRPAQTRGYPGLWQPTRMRPVRTPERRPQAWCDRPARGSLGRRARSARPSHSGSRRHAAACKPVPAAGADAGLVPFEGIDAFARLRWPGTVAEREHDWRGWRRRRLLAEVVEAVVLRLLVHGEQHLAHDLSVPIEAKREIGRESLGRGDERQQFPRFAVELEPQIIVATEICSSLKPADLSCESGTPNRRAARRPGPPLGVRSVSDRQLGARRR